MKHILFTLFPDVESSEFIQTVNDPPLLPGGGEVAMETRMVIADGVTRVFRVGKVTADGVYILWCEVDETGAIR